MAKQLGGVKIVSNPQAPDLFADDAVSIEEVNGTVRITLAVAKLDDGTAPSPMSLVVIGRLVMGEQSAQRLTASLLNHFNGRGVRISPVDSEDIRPN